MRTTHTIFSVQCQVFNLQFVPSTSSVIPTRKPPLTSFWYAWARTKESQGVWLSLRGGWDGGETRSRWHACEGPVWGLVQRRRRGHRLELGEELDKTMTTIVTVYRPQRCWKIIRRRRCYGCPDQTPLLHRSTSTQQGRRIDRRSNKYVKAALSTKALTSTWR